MIEVYYAVYKRNENLYSGEDISQAINIVKETRGEVQFRVYTKDKMGVSIDTQNFKNGKFKGNKHRIITEGELEIFVALFSQRDGE